MRTILLVNASPSTRVSHSVLIGPGDWKVVSDSVKSCRVLITPIASTPMEIVLDEQFTIQATASAQVINIEPNNSSISIHLQRL